MKRNRGNYETPTLAIIMFARENVNTLSVGNSTPVDGGEEDWAATANFESR